MKLAAGDRLGSYEIIDLLGAGGMGEVYRARDTRLGREVAIKVLPEEAARDESRLRRFFSEAKAASALNHPNILTVYGLGEERDSPYLVTELIAGRTVRSLLAPGALPLARALDIAIQTLAGLVKAHQAGIVHRDLKPENLMVTEDGFVKILDFGLAKLLKGDSNPGTPSGLDSLGGLATETGLILGTASYMSPEQARGETADARSDLFSVGVILYEMVAGVNPFRRASVADTLSALLRDPPPPLADGAPPALAAVIERVLNKDAASRQASARELEMELRALAASVASAAPGSDMTLRLDSRTGTPGAVAAAPQKSRLRKIVAIAAGLAAVLAGSVVLWIVLARRAALSTAAPAASSDLDGRRAVAVMAIDDRTKDATLGTAGVGLILADAFVQILYDCQDVHVVSPLRVDSVAKELGRSYLETASDIGLARKVSERAEASVMLTGALSRLGDTYVLSAALTELPSEKLLGSFRAESHGQDGLLETVTANISEKITGALSGNKEPRRQVGEVATRSVEAYAPFVRGFDLILEGNWDAAIPELEKAVESDPKMGVAWSELSCAYSFSGDETRAKEAQDRALTLKDRMSHRDQMWIESTSAWLEGKGPAYRAKMEAYIHEYPDDRQGYFYLGLGWQWLDRDCSQALRSYAKALDLTPNYYPIVKAMVDCRVELGERDKAIDLLRQYLKTVRPGHGHDQAISRLAELSQ